MDKDVDTVLPGGDSQPAIKGVMAARLVELEGDSNL